MNIGFDAKRAYQNATGLGHYSRTLISSLARYFPGNEYYLFAPKTTGMFDIAAMPNVQAVVPANIPASIFKTAWRSSWVKKDLLKNKIDLYHGLSHEIPVNIAKTGIKSVVTMHDLIFERYPEQYIRVDVQIYRRKFQYACRNADQVIAISEQTKKDLIDFYKTDAGKITVCYQSCNPSFNEIVPEEKKQAVKQLYNLPDRFFLYTGSVIERKNLLLICKAMKQSNAIIPLVVIGDGVRYKAIVKKFVAENGLKNKVFFLSETPAGNLPAFRSAADFPAIYQQATAMIYPSTFEGFGIPVLEAMCSRLPVITSNVSCMPETGGDAAWYIDPLDAGQLAEAMSVVATDEVLRKGMIERGVLHANKFDPQKCAAAVMNVYKQAVS